jgi:hypothetical protein
MIVSRGLLIVLAAIAAACLVIAFISIDSRFLTVSALASLAVFGLALGMACPQSVRYGPLRFGTDRGHIS